MSGNNTGLVKIIDIETSNLLEAMVDHTSFPYKLKPDAKLHVVVIRDAYTDELFTAEGSNITKEWMRESLKSCKYLVHHNGIKFDLKALELFGVLDYTIGYLDEPDTLFGEPVTMVDTLILSRLFNPDRFGGHSLASWGERTGAKKMDFRGELIKSGLIPKDAPKGDEFLKFTPLMTTYCIEDTLVGKNTFFALMNEKAEYPHWDKAIKMETKLADLAIRRESLGFWFDKELALKCLDDLTAKMSELQERVNPILPLKPMTKGELSGFTPTATQLKKDGSPNHHIVNFANRVGAKILENDEKEYFLEYKDKKHKLPYHEPLETHAKADISDLDHVKTTLIDVYRWIPSEWAVRDFTKDSKKVSLPLEKRIKAFERWFKETVIDGKYTKLRLEVAFKDHRVKSVEELEDSIREKLKGDYPVRLPTSPRVRVGIEKELCPNLLSLGEKVSFAKDFALFLTYKHRKSSIAGGDIEDMDFDEEVPNSGYLNAYREEDSRIPTPAIEIGSSTGRYRHIAVANVARATSVYGKEMRSLFGCGEGFVQLGFDFSSLEARINGHYVKKYPFGEELAEALVAEKPNDIHSVNSRKLDIDRGTVKSVAYAILYGCSVKKLEDMLGYSPAQAKKFYDDYWDAVPALRDFKKAIETFWEKNGKVFLPGIDGRKLRTRSKHSLTNLLFQSCGVISAKYVTVLLMQDMEKQGLCTDPFKGTPDVCSMIEYHDENQLLTSKNLYSFKVFPTEEEAENFSKLWDNSQGQLSSIGHSDKGYYIALPNVVSTGIEKAITKTEQLLKLNVNLGFEWIAGKNWYQCH